MIIRFTPEADSELAEACQWYAHQREDLDLEFMQSIDGARLSDAFRSLCFMKSPWMRFRS